MDDSFTLLADDLAAALRRHPLYDLSTRLTSIAPGELRAPLDRLVIGDLCALEDSEAGGRALAQVVATRNGEAVLAPLGGIEGLSSRVRLRPLWRRPDVACGPHLLGRVIDGIGNPIDGAEMPANVGETRELSPRSINPMERPPVDTPLSTGVRAIDGLATLGAGQRIGVFGAAGSGKTSFIGSLARNVDCDVCVLALIGERGREVREFLDRQLPPAFRSRCVVVAATSDRPAMERVNAAHVAMTVAEYFRDQGLRVLVLFDSVTRFARALREVGLSAGEAPVRRGYPASVYSELPRLVERGGLHGDGSITAVFTVLVENEGEDDPIAEEVQSLCDGHVIPSTKLAQAGHYPAIDPLASKSRLMNEIVEPEHRRAADKARALLAKYRDIELLVQVGEYKAGSDPMADEAIELRPAILAFLAQDSREGEPLARSIERLRATVHQLPEAK